MMREWGGRARQHWKDDVFQKDLRKLVFAETANFSGRAFLMPIVAAAGSDDSRLRRSAVSDSR